MPRIGLCVVVLCLSVPPALAQPFVNWENPHVHPLDITPDGDTLLAVNTADNRLEVFDITSGAALHLGAIPVGLDPVSVRARTSTEAWVVNHISDSISIVDLATMRVVFTIRTDDEPADVVFVGSSPQKAFVSCSQANTVVVFDTAAPATRLATLAIDGEDPRSMAVNVARGEVYVAVFESGNRSTILGGGLAMGGTGFPPNVVNDPAGPYGGVNPPPNDGTNFKPPQRAGNPAPPGVGLIVKKNGAGLWMDDNAHDWTSMVSGANHALSGRPADWDLFDHDIAIIDATTHALRYANGLMNIGMALAVNPANEQITLVGTDATNEVRFEPVLEGRFLRVNLARVTPTPATVGISDLNQHLSYGTTVPFVAIPQGERDKSLGDPRAIVWNAAGTRGYVAGMGSNNVVIIDAAGTRQPLLSNPLDVTIDVAEGPTGLALDETRGRLYVLSKFAARVSVVDTATETVLTDVGFYDPSPIAIKIGRKHLYDTHRNSGLGQIACASCHVDARNDRLAWDLGNPDGTVKTFNQNCPLGGCQDWHPMKGPMTTQTLQDIIGREPHHWRGDRNGLEEFAGAFTGLQGDDLPLPSPDMQEFESFLATIHFPPNPSRNAGRYPVTPLDNGLPSNLPLPGHFTTGRFAPAGQPLPNGNAVTGLTAYRTGGLDTVQCVTCHTLPTGMGLDGAFTGFPPTFQPLPPGPNGEHHLALVSQDGSTNVSIKIPHLRNMHEKVGFEMTQTSNRSGFGFLHDGSVDSLARFLNEPVFNVTSDQQTADLVAFMLSFAGSDLPQGSPTNPLEPPGVAGKDTHAAVGWQTTLIDDTSPAPGQILLISDMIGLANTNKVGLIVKGVQGGIARGYRYNGGGNFQSDRFAETITSGALQAAAAPGSELTYTIVPKGSETRIGIDRDDDGFYDREELDACSDPANAASVPGDPSVDIDSDGDEDFTDVAAFVAVLLGSPQDVNHTPRCDLNCDGAENGLDIHPFVDAFLTPSLAPLTPRVEETEADIAPRSTAPESVSGH
ncbi:MAG TPA: hypothetical protein VJZ71_08790 [Phycisphaerae bacterium]|nr:hypothetical protein [Phycisphaerae bacterium]